MGSYSSFQDLQAEAVRLRDAGAPDQALELLTAEAHRFPDHTAYAYLMRMQLNAELGRMDEALRLFAEALSAGCRYPLPVVQGPRLARLHDTVEFTRLAHIAAMRYDAELAASRPKLVLRRPAAATVGTLLVLHGNDSRADRTVPHWEHALELGWTLALAQSAEISWTPGMFAWNDAVRSREQLLHHVEELRRAGAGAPLAVAGYSMGALRALELACSVPAVVRGALAVGPFLPRDAADRLAGALAVPTAIVVGEHDGEARPGSETVVRALRDRGVPARLDIVAGAGHAYPIDMRQRLEAALPFAAGADR